MSHESQQGHIFRVPWVVIENKLLPYLSLKELGELRQTCRAFNNEKVQIEFFKRQQLFVIHCLKADLVFFREGDLRDHFLIVIAYMEKWITEKNPENLTSFLEKLQKRKMLDDSEETGEREFNESLNYIMRSLYEDQNIPDFLSILEESTKILLKKQPAYSLKSEGNIDSKRTWLAAKLVVMVFLIGGGVASIAVGAVMFPSGETVPKLLLGLGIPTTLIGALTGTLSSSCIQKSRQRFCNFFRSQPELPPIDIEAAQTEEPLFQDISSDDDADEENVTLLSLSTAKFRNG